MQMEMWKLQVDHICHFARLIHVPVLAATKREQPKTKTQICLLILHFKWSCMWYHVPYSRWDRQSIQYICSNWKMYTKLSRLQTVHADYNQASSTRDSFPNSKVPRA